jgi:exonuclease III
MSTNLKFTSYNAKGLAGSRKRLEVFNWIKKDFKGIVFIQEAHCKKIKEKAWSKQLGRQYEIYFSHGSTQRNGVVTIIPRNYVKYVTKDWSDKEGRIKLIQLTINQTIYSLLNVYAPTADKPKEQITFFNQLDKIFSEISHTKILSGGDFNSVFNPLLDKHKPKENEKPLKAAQELKNIIESHNLIDIWRVTNPNTKKFTWSGRTANGISKSRIDYWLISDTIQYQCSNIDIGLGYRSDHNPVVLTYAEKDNKNKGRGYWKLNNLLLNDNEYISMIKDTINQHITDYENDDNHILNWDTLKMSIRRESVSFAIRKAKKRREHKKETSNRINNLENLINIGMVENIQEMEEELEVVKNEWTEIVGEEVKGIIFRSRCKWTEESERSTKYFLTLEKHRSEIRNIITMEVENNLETSDQNKIREHIEKFYHTLYQKPTIEDPEINIDCNMEATLDDSDRDSTDADISIEELYEALKDLPNNKTPGTDGLSAEFYKKLWNSIKTPLYKCYKKIFEEGKMSLDQRTGVINLLPKPGKNLKIIGNWRPITVLNTDYKILAKTLANKMKPLLPNIINKNQTGFMKNRLIGENIRIIQDLLDYTFDNNIEGYLLFLDFEKAFDSISWNFIQETLKKFNFGDKFRKWINILYNDISSIILFNGHLSSRIYPQRGIRQGCPISAFLFILCAEIMANQIRDDPKIDGININNKTFKVTQFADDTALILKDWESVQASIQLLEKFEKLSGLKVNKSKSQIVILGRTNDKAQDSKKERDKEKSHNKNDLLWSQSFKYLGISFDPNPIEMEYKNFRHRIDNMKNILKMWKMRDLTLKGKIIVIKNLALSQLIYPMTYLEVSKEVYKECKEVFYDFLWSGKKGNIKYTTLIREINDGGLKMIDLDCMVKALKVKMLAKMVEETDELWCVIPNQYLTPMNIKDFCLCRYKVKWIPNEVPQYYRQSLYAYSLIKNTMNNQLSDIRCETLWFNSNILRNKEPMFIEEWYRKGILFIGDILDNNNQILLPDDLEVKYDLSKNNFLQHYSLRKSLPPEWRRILENKSNSKFDRDIEPLFQYNDDKNITIGGTSTKMLYHSFIRLLTKDIPYSNFYWTNEHSIPEEKLWKYFRLPYLVIRNTKIQIMQYKIQKQVFPCQKMLKQWRVENDSTCKQCTISATDDIVHYFCACEQIQLFWSSFNKWWSNICIECIIVDDIDVLLGKYCKKCHFVQLNFTLLCAKWFIYTTKKDNRSPFFLDFLSYLKKNLQIEYAIYKRNDNTYKYETMWGEIYDLL